MTKGILVHTYGGPEVLSYEDMKVRAPGAGEATIRHTAIGVNFIDVYHRTGLYPLPLPLTPGNEGAGVITAIGDGVTGFKPGDRVAYAMMPGSYAQERVASTKFLVRLPDDIKDEVAAGMMLKGLTAEYLLYRTFPVKAGQTILIHAAAGGVGLIAGQWAKHLGCTVIGTVGTRDKGKLALENGYDHVIHYRDEDFAARVREITKGALCDVVYDGVGKTTFPASLDCLKPLGMFVSFGNASGPVDAFNLGLLAQKGSLYATRPTLGTYAANRKTLDEMAANLFDALRRGIVKAQIHAKYKLSEAEAAHRALESRATTGAIVLEP